MTIKSADDLIFQDEQEKLGLNKPVDKVIEAPQPDIPGDSIDPVDPNEEKKPDGEGEAEELPLDRKSTRLNSSHAIPSRMPSSA